MSIDTDVFGGIGPPAFPLLETSTTQLDTWSRCDRRFMYRYLRGLVPIGVNDNLQWGTLWHQCAQEYYRAMKAGVREDSALTRAQRVAETTTLVENRFHGDTAISLDAKQRQTLWDTFLYYYHQVACMDDWDEIVSVEDQVYLIIGYRGQPVMKIRSTLDLLAKKDKRLCVVDHKTTGDVQNNLDFLSLDMQCRVYALAAAAYYETEPMVCYNMIARDVPPGFGNRSLLTDSGKKRSPDTLASMQDPSKYLRREWLNYTPAQFAAMQRTLVQDALTIQFEGNSGIWPRRVVKMGGMACTSCPYFAICGAELDGRIIDDNAPLITMAFSRDPNCGPPLPQIEVAR